MEDTDLEFKLQPWAVTEGGSKECALDIADKANAVGALIVIGIREDGDGRAVEICPVPQGGEDDLGLRVHQIVAQRISPPPVVTHRQVLIDGGDVHMITVAPTTRSPHGVAVGGDAFRFPVRTGVTRRLLSEPEIADRYQRRFMAAVEQRDRLDAAHRQVAALVPSERESGEPWSWLIVAAAPEFSGDLALRRGLADEWKDWANSAFVDFPAFSRGAQLRVATGFRRLHLSDDLSGSSTEIYSSGGYLGLSGEGALVMGYPGGSDAIGSVPNTSMVWDEHLVGDLINAVGLLAGHAARCGAVGYLAVSAELVSDTPMVVGQYRNQMLRGQFSGTRSVTGTTGKSEHVAFLDDLAQPGRDRIAITRLLALDLLSAFGMSEVQQITENGEFALDRFTADRQPRVKQWAAEAGVPTVDKLLG